MPIEFCAHITRQQVRATVHSHTYLFGDNERRSGYGGQAAQMRGEPNAIGIRTKTAPHNSANAFWRSSQWPTKCHLVDVDFSRVHAAIEQARIIVIPRSGLGTGLARLADNAPEILIHIERHLRFCHELDEWCEARRAGLVNGSPPQGPFATDEMALRISINISRGTV